MGARPWRAMGASGAIIAAATALGLGLRVYQLSRPGYLFGLTEYDDGTFFGNSVRLAYGAIPYRDFVSVEPPGSTLLMLPIALVAKAVGTGWGLAIARLLTLCADAATIAVIGLLTRHRGAFTTAVACGILAVYPDAIFAGHTLLLEPWLNLFCLVAALLLFRGDDLADNRSILFGGLLFGCAATIKLWAFVAAGIAAILCLPRLRRAAAFASGVAAGVAAVVIPFAIAAPRSLLQDVILGQFTRSASGSRVLLPRLADLSGLSGISGAMSATNLYVPAWIVVGGSVAICGYVLAGYLGAAVFRRRRPTALDGYALLGAAAVIAMFCWPAEFYAHYAAFFGPFLALVVALPTGTLARHHSLAGRAGTWTPKLAMAAAVAAIGLMAFTQAGVEEDVIPAADPASVADRIIPPGACVVTDTASLTVVSNRFVSNVRGCPLVVDSFGTLIAATGGRDMAASGPVLSGIAHAWQSWFMRAQFVWLDGPTFGRIPWDEALTAFFTTSFRRVLPFGPGGGPGAEGGLYVRVATTAAGSARGRPFPHAPTVSVAR